jgi:hypothetical protein
MVLGTLLNKEVQSLVGRPDIPAILLVELGESEPVSIRDVRVRTLGDGAIALDLNFLIPSAGESLVEKGPGSGWSVNVPEETLLGLMQAAALMAPVGDEPLAIQPEGLVIGKAGFILDIRALSKKRFGQYKEFMIMGTVGLNERGEIDLVANEALLSGSSTNRPDLLTLLLKQKILQTVASALTMSIPGIYSEELGERTVRLAIESLRMGEGEIEVAGDLEFGRVVEEGTPTVLTPKRE